MENEVFLFIVQPYWRLDACSVRNGRCHLSTSFTYCPKTCILVMKKIDNIDGSHIFIQPKMKQELFT